MSLFTYIVVILAKDISISFNSTFTQGLQKVVEVDPQPSWTAWSTCVGRVATTGIVFI